MKTVFGVVTGSARFLYRFLVGDDWVVATVMLAGLALTGILAAGGANAWWITPPLAVVMTGMSLRYRRAATREPSDATSFRTLGRTDPTV